MIKSKVLLVGSIIALSINASAAVYTTPTTITGFTISAEVPTMRIKVSSVATDAKSMCAKSDYYALDLTQETSSYIISTIIAAKHSGTKVGFSLEGCHGLGGNYSYPKVEHIYSCEKKYCAN